jgi:predicted small secreted protein
MHAKIYIAAVLSCLVLAACNEADTASRNLSVAADRFEVTRRITFINGITDKYLLTVEGLCSLGNMDKPRELTVTCKTGPNLYKKSFLGLSDNVTYVAEQLEANKVDPYHYRIAFRPATIIPDIDLQTQ